MTDKKVIAVFGATGAQGGGLARAILADSNSPFTVRALTRDPASEAAKKLAAAGAEVVRADVDDTDSIRASFDGAYGVFCVTFFWQQFDPARETKQAKSMAKAASDAGIQHVIWSTLEDTRLSVPLDDDRMPTLMGNYKCPHFDCKGEADEAFATGTAPATLLRTSFYWDNFIHFGMAPRRGEDGKLTLVLPMGDKKLPAIAAEDIGKCAYGVFKRGEDFKGRTIGIAGGMPTGAEMAEGFAKALGEPVSYYPISFDDYRALGFPGAEDLGNMFQFKHDFNGMYCGNRDLALSKELNPALQSFEEWVTANASRIPIIEPATATS